MSDVEKLLKQILSDEKLLGSRAFRDKVYTDVPILRKASQLKRPETPQRIKDMKAMALTPEAYWKTSAWLFCAQGRSMADYEDDMPYEGEITQVYPTYRDLTTEQLRGYFTWRTNVRKGIIGKAPAPYPFMYVYELLNGIGCEHGEENCRRISEFCKAYSAADSVLDGYCEKWVCDYVIYHGLSPELLEDMAESQNEKHILTLMHWEEHTPDEICEAIGILSSYRTEQSRYAQESPDIFRAVLYRSFVLLSEFFRDKRKNSLCSKLFGAPTETVYRLFDTAVFYDQAAFRDTEYTVNELRSYICRHGKWYCKRLAGSRHRSAKLGELVKAVDSVLRDENHYQYKLSNVTVSKQERSIIRSAIAEYNAAVKKKEAVKIEIDLSKLSGIRKAADITRDKLIVDEEVPEEEETVTAEKNAQETAEDSPLSEAETDFLRALISGGDYNEAARKAMMMPSILADTINDKLFDTFSDTVLMFDGDEPVIIEDYLEELKNIAGI